jgi:hypothetical protein
MLAFMAAYRTWLAVGITGFFAGFGLFLAVPGLSHLGLVIAIAAPVIAFYRSMKPVIGRRHCPTRPEWTAR